MLPGPPPAEGAPFLLRAPLLGRVSGEQEAAATPLPTCVWLLLPLHLTGSLARWWCQAVGSPLARACLVHRPPTPAPCPRHSSFPQHICASGSPLAPRQRVT